MRVEATASTMSWIPSEVVRGPLKAGFDAHLTHYDDPPPDRVDGLAAVRALRDADRFRFANVASVWAEVEDGTVVDAGWDPGSGLQIGGTTVRIGPFGTTFRAVSLPVLQRAPERSGTEVRFVQTAGGRTGAPLPRPVPHRPFAQWLAPTVWSTLAVTVRADGTSSAELVGASAFPRHWLFGPDGRLAAKTGVLDQTTWMNDSFGERTPWGDQDSEALVVAAESDLERQLSAELMSGRRPAVRRLSDGEVLTRQSEPGSELYLVLDGVLEVEVDGRVLGQVGPGAVLGERALLEGGDRTATLRAATPVTVAVAEGGAVDLDRLAELAGGHRREDVPGG